MSESNFNIESCLISKLLETKDILTLKDNQIKPSYFTGDNRNAYLFIQDTFLSSGEVPTVRVFTRKFPHYNLEVHTVSGSEVVGTDESLKFWCDEIRKKVKHNRIADMVESVADKLKDLNTEDAYALIKKEISYIESEVVETSSVDITKDTQSRIDAYLEKKKNHGMRGIPTGFKHLDYILKGLEKETLTTVIAGTGVGKAVTLDTPILTPNGFVPMKEIKVGSVVYDEMGNSCNVLAAYPQGEKQVYRVTFEDGTHVDCCSEHLWKFKTIDDLTRGKNWRLETTAQLLNRSIKSKRGYNLCIPVNHSVKHTDKDLPVDPYLLGCLLGDGGFTTDRITFTNPELDIVDHVKNVSLQYNGSFVPHKGNNIQYVFTSNDVRCNTLYQKIKSLGLTGKSSESKFIPPDYLLASETQRLDLARGLIDTDGHVDRKGHILFNTSSKKLLSDFVYLIRSLGFKCTQREYVRNSSKVDYVAYISCDTDILFTSNKHKNRYCNKCISKRRNYYDILKIVSIEKLESSKEMQCITVSSPYSTFICGDFKVTHNTWFQIVVGARCQLENYRVLQLVTEMGNDVMRDRYEAVLYSMCYDGFDYNKFKSGNLDMKTEQKYFQFLTEDLPTFEPLILDVATSVMNVSALIDKYNPDIVFIDSAYLMEDDQGAKDDWLRVAHITRDLKKLAKRCKKPIVINTQADKNSSKKVGPEMDSIMYTQAIGQDCLPADTYVLTEQGYKLIQNLENEVFFIFDGFKYKKSHCVRATEDKQVVNIKYLGRTFQCSPNHKLYVFDNEVGSYVWKRAKDIEVGNDYLVYYDTGNVQGFPHILRVTSKRGTKSITSPIDATEELGRIIGYLIGDGSFNRSHNTVTLSCGYDEEYAKEAVRIVNKYFNLEGCIKLQKTRFSKSEQINVCWYSASFYDWCEFMLTKDNVRILNPSFIEMNYSFRRGVICGLLQSDGCFSRTFSFSTVHYQIASTLCNLLSSIGVITTISTKNHKGCVSYRVNIKRSCESIIKSLNFVGERKSMCEVPNTTSQVLNIRQPSSYVKELSSCIVDSSDNSNDKLTKRAYEARRKGNTSVLTLKEFEDQLNIYNPFIFVPVESVMITDEFVPMYDIQVFSTDKRIITGGIVTHNSDNVLALYRDDVMRQDNEMGIKVLKQREGTLGKVLSNWDFESMNFDEIYFEGSQSDDDTSDSHDDERNLIGVD